MAFVNDEGIEVRVQAIQAHICPMDNNKV